MEPPLPFPEVQAGFASPWEGRPVFGEGGIAVSQMGVGPSCVVSCVQAWQMILENLFRKGSSVPGLGSELLGNHAKELSAGNQSSVLVKSLEETGEPGQFIPRRHCPPKGGTA